MLSPSILFFTFIAYNFFLVLVGKLFIKKEGYALKNLFFFYCFANLISYFLNMVVVHIYTAYFLFPLSPYRFFYYSESGISLSAFFEIWTNFIKKLMPNVFSVLSAIYHGAFITSIYAVFSRKRKLLEDFKAVNKQIKSKTTVVLIGLVLILNLVWQLLWFINSGNINYLSADAELYTKIVSFLWYFSSFLVLMMFKERTILFFFFYQLLNNFLGWYLLIAAIVNHHHFLATLILLNVYNFVFCGLLFLLFKKTNNIVLIMLVLLMMLGTNLCIPLII